ncbi:META domain-containing protein [Allosphingosinicella indica]|nr:META domain-containing protein [Allosphingosinicella indica]
MIRIVLPALFALTACAPMDAPPAPPPPAQGAAYRALGTEPFWSVTIADGTMTYEAAGEPAVRIPAPEPRTSFNGHRYVTPRLTVDITHAECSDGMSDRRYPDTVKVTMDGRNLNGCGGDALEPANLDGTNWSMTAIGGESVPAGDRYFLRFRDGRIEGKAGCNGFGGGYSVDGGTLQPGPIIATRMACAEPAMTHERKTLEILGGPAQIAYRGGDTLLITRNNATLTLKRAY